MTWFDSAEIIAFSTAALEKVGVPTADAALTARSLVVADQRGTHSHGTLRLPLYVAAIEQGGIAATPQMRWVAENGACALLEADAGLGQVAMQLAVERVASLAREFGVGVVSVQGSSHFGAGSFWAQQLTDDGFLAFVTSTTGPTVAPYGGSEKVFGTNPLTLGAPSIGGESLMADLATSTGAYGKVIAARNSGEQIPAGWAVDENGQETLDPSAAMRGALTPFGGHKGSAISAALEAFASILGQGTFAFETQDIWENPGSRMNIGQLIFAIDPEKFSGRAFTEQRTATLVSQIRGSSSSDEAALAPGDPEQRRQVESGARVNLIPSDVIGLQRLGERLGVPMPNPIDVATSHSAFA